MRKPTYYDRLKNPPEQSIEELCRPLSATVLPKSQQHGSFGQELSANKARARQRQTTRMPGTVRIK